MVIACINMAIGYSAIGPFNGKVYVKIEPIKSLALDYNGGGIFEKSFNPCIHNTFINVSCLSIN